MTFVLCISCPFFWRIYDVNFGDESTVLLYMYVCMSTSIGIQCSIESGE